MALGLASLCCSGPCLEVGSWKRAVDWPKRLLPLFQHVCLQISRLNDLQGTTHGASQNPHPLSHL